MEILYPAVTVGVYEVRKYFCLDAASINGGTADESFKKWAIIYN